MFVITLQPAKCTLRLCASGVRSKRCCPSPIPVESSKNGEPRRNTRHLAASSAQAGAGSPDWATLNARPRLNNRNAILSRKSGTAAGNSSIRPSGDFCQISRVDYLRSGSVVYCCLAEGGRPWNNPSTASSDDLDDKPRIIARLHYSHHTDARRIPLGRHSGRDRPFRRSEVPHLCP